MAANDKPEISGTTGTVRAQLSGGRALEKHLKTIREKLGGTATVNVGFFESEKYAGGVHHWSKSRLEGMFYGRQLAEFLQGKKKYAGSVAQVAFWNEFGTKTAPPRPFMRQTVASKSPRWGRALGMALKRTNYDARAALAIMGQGIQKQMRETITAFNEPKNTDVTRDLKGFNKPLVDSGTMRNAVDYQVIEGEE